MTVSVFGSYKNDLQVVIALFLFVGKFCTYSHKDEKQEFKRTVNNFRDCRTFFVILYVFYQANYFHRSLVSL